MMTEDIREGCSHIRLVKAAMIIDHVQQATNRVGIVCTLSITAMQQQRVRWAEAQSVAESI